MSVLIGALQLTLTLVLDAPDTVGAEGLAGNSSTLVMAIVTSTVSLALLSLALMVTE